MSRRFFVRRTMRNLAGRQMASESFDQLGFCAFHAPKSWKQENGIPLEAKRNMTLGDQWTHLRYDPATKRFIATVLMQKPQEQFEAATLGELEHAIAARYGG